jgi:hypothetical protein
MSSLAHKTVVILGGTSGEPGDREGRTGRGDRQNGEQQPPSELGSGARTVALDVTDEAGTARCFRISTASMIHSSRPAAWRSMCSSPRTARRCGPRWTSLFWVAFNAAKYGAAKMNAGGSIRCFMGSNRFHVDMPRYLDLYRQGG